MKVKSESEVAQLCPTLRDPMDCNPSDSSIRGIFQARVLEWGAITFSELILCEHQFLYILQSDREIAENETRHEPALMEFVILCPWRWLSVVEIKEKMD